MSCRSRGIKRKATVKSDGSWFCDDCFVKHIHNKMLKNIKRYHMFKQGDIVMVALSGGKDSNLLLHALNMLKGQLKISLIGLHINLGLGQFSEESLSVVKQLTERLDIGLIVVEPDLPIMRYGHREVCAVCGAVKRYYMNSIAKEIGATVVATGHTLDDQTIYLIKNITGDQIEYLLKQTPVLDEYKDEKGTLLIRKVKPIFNIPEEDIEYYNKIFNLPVVNTTCPNKPKIRDVQREVIRNLEKGFKNFRRLFVKHMIEDIIPNIKVDQVNRNLNRCKVCGEPTPGDVCLICRLKQQSGGFERK